MGGRSRSSSFVFEAFRTLSRRVLTMGTASLDVISFRPEGNGESGVRANGHERMLTGRAEQFPMLLYRREVRVGQFGAI
jgi:hypothetical protein